MFATNKLTDSTKLIYSSTSELIRAIRGKRISSVELVQAFADRIGEVNSDLNAVVHVCLDPALEHAETADTRLSRGELLGPLHGVPFTVKDSFETSGILTTAGTEGLRHNIPETSATVVERLMSAGAILLGKTNVPELTLRFITDNHIYGRTNNPYDLSRTPAGSSGGAAAIVAAGGSPFEMGSDTGGSIRIPAAFCGVAALKPTRGRVPRTGHIPFLEFGALEALMQVGPMARFVGDLRLLLPIISGPDSRDPYAKPVPAHEFREEDLGELRIAVYTKQGDSEPTEATVEAIQSAAQAMSDTGASIRNDRPPGIDAAPALWRALFCADGGAGVRNCLRKLGTEEIHPVLEWTQQGKELSASEYAELQTRWNLFQSKALAFLDEYDVILCPVNGTPAILHDQPTPFRYTYAYNLLGWPVVVVRAGTSPEDLPIGIQIVGRPWQEEVVLAVAEHIEKSLGGWRPPSI